MPKRKIIEHAMITETEDSLIIEVADKEKKIQQNEESININELWGTFSNKTHPGREGNREGVCLLSIEKRDTLSYV